MNYLCVYLHNNLEKYFILYGHIPMSKNICDSNSSGMNINNIFKMDSNKYENCTTLRKCANFDSDFGRIFVS